MIMLTAHAIYCIIGAVAFVVVFIIVYTNRAVKRGIEPLTARITKLEIERQEANERYGLLQRLYKELQEKYNLLQAWAMGLVDILTRLGQDYPEPPTQIVLNAQNHKGLSREHLGKEKNVDIGIG